MAIASKHSRSITVDGERLRWWYRLPYCGNPDCPQGRYWTGSSR